MICLHLSPERAAFGAQGPGGVQGGAPALRHPPEGAAPALRGPPRPGEQPQAARARPAHQQTARHHGAPGQEGGRSHSHRHQVGLPRLRLWLGTRNKVGAPCLLSL